MKWVKWKKYHGVKHTGIQKYNPLEPWSEWDQIMGVVARCEGNHDTVVSYDNTGVTWGFLQWTFTSGRLQKLVTFMSTIEVSEDYSVFDLLFCNEQGTQVFDAFGFQIVNGKFIDVLVDPHTVLNPYKKKKRLVDLCMGRVGISDSVIQKNRAVHLAEIFVEAGQYQEAQEAQIAFAKVEFKRSLNYKRGPLGDVKTIRNLLGDSWGTPLPALFFNLWQNNPGAAYKLFLRAKKNSDRDVDKYFELAWKYANLSKFGNWGWGKPANKSPRVVRIKKALKEFYDVDLHYYK